MIRRMPAFVSMFLVVVALGAASLLAINTGNFVWSDWISTSGVEEKGPIVQAGTTKSETQLSKKPAASAPVQSKITTAECESFGAASALIVEAERVAACAALLRDLKRQVADLQAEKSSADKQVEVLKGENFAAGKRYEALQLHADSQKKQLADLRAQDGAMQAKVTAMTAKLAKAGSANTKDDNENVFWQRKYQACNAQLTQARPALRKCGLVWEE